MMKAADSMRSRGDQPDAGQVELLRKRFQPKIQIPRKVDSRKKAARPSMASGPPNTLPTSRE